MADLSQLIERVEKLDGPNREADCTIAVLIDGFEANHEDRPGQTVYVKILGDGGKNFPGGPNDMLVPDYTSSLDAAIALCERVLPDNSAWSVNWCGTAAVSTDANGIIGAEAATPAIALVLALLRALSREA